jgi:hypothetical protein
VEPQAPFAQVLVVQGLPSEHATVLLVNTQAPVAVVHELLVQMLLSSHTLGVPVQTPFVQTSFVRQRLVLVQAVPSVTGGLLHKPFTVLQVPCRWH